MLQCDGLLPNSSEKRCRQFNLNVLGIVGAKIDKVTWSAVQLSHQLDKLTDRLAGHGNFTLFWSRLDGNVHSYGKSGNVPPLTAAPASLFGPIVTPSCN